MEASSHQTKCAAVPTVEASSSIESVAVPASATNSQASVTVNSQPFTTQTCLFFSMLPGEIRNHIYEDFFRGNEIKLYQGRGRPAKDPTNPLELCHKAMKNSTYATNGILLACKTTRKEALIFFAKHTTVSIQDLQWPLDKIEDYVMLESSSLEKVVLNFMQSPSLKNVNAKAVQEKFPALRHLRLDLDMNITDNDYVPKFGNAYYQDFIEDWKPYAHDKQRTITALSLFLEKSIQDDHAMNWLGHKIGRYHEWKGKEIDLCDWTGVEVTINQSFWVVEADEFHGIDVDLVVDRFNVYTSFGLNDGQDTRSTYPINAELRRLIAAWLAAAAKQFG